MAHHCGALSQIGGAKNAALPLLAATLLTGEECTLTNVPDLSDIHTMVELLRALGADVEFDTAKHRVQIQAANISTTSAPPELVAKMRASFLVAGPMLGPVQRDDRLDARRLQARRAPGRCRRPRIPQDGRRGPGH